MGEYWTRFCDISGGQITNWIHLYVEAAESVAVDVVERLIGFRPSGMACPCCEQDYDKEEGCARHSRRRGEANSWQIIPKRLCAFIDGCKSSHGITSADLKCGIWTRRKIP